MNSHNNAAAFRELVWPPVGVWFIFWLPAPAVFVALLPISLVLACASSVLAWMVAWLLLLRKILVIEIAGEHLRVGKARIALKYLGKPEAITSTQAFSQRGPNLDARAFTAFQPGVNTLLKVEISDEKDPTPYWLFSSRRSEEIVAAISGA